MNTKTATATLSIAYISGHYEVMMFRGDSQSNPVYTSTVEAAEAQAIKWWKRYGIEIHRNYKWQEPVAKEIEAMEHERRIRNQERDFARAAGWQYEPYWEDAPLADLIAEQKKYFHNE